MMDVLMLNLGCLCFKQQFYRACSLRTCFLLLLIFLLLLFITAGVPTLIIIFIWKPQKPSFTPQSMTLDAYKLKVHSNSSLFVSALASLVFNTSNPNKFGLRYSPSRLRIYSQGLPVAEIRVPGFSQPAHSRNLSVRTVVLINSVNVSQVVGGSLLQAKSGQNNVQMKLLGDVKVKLHLLHITLPKIKVALDCDINFDYKELVFLKGLYGMGSEAKKAIASLSDDSKYYFKKCSFAIYI